MGRKAGLGRPPFEEGRERLFFDRSEAEPLKKADRRAAVKLSPELVAPSSEVVGEEPYRAYGKRRFSQRWLGGSSRYQAT